MTKRAAIYARVSTDDQRANYSIPVQIEACLERVAKLGYGQVGDRFVDSESGRFGKCRKMSQILSFLS